MGSMTPWAARSMTPWAVRRFDPVIVSFAVPSDGDRYYVACGLGYATLPCVNVETALKSWKSGLLTRALTSYSEDASFSPLTRTIWKEADLSDPRVEELGSP